MLRAHGHNEVLDYTIGTVMEEVRLVKLRVNALMVTEAIGIQLAIASALSKDGAKAFTNHIKKLSEN